MISAPAPYGGCGIQHTSMTAIAQFVDGTLDVDISLIEGDQLILTAGGVFTDDDASGNIHGQLLLDGSPVQGQTVNPSAVGETHSLVFPYAYSASTTGSINFTVSSSADTVEDTYFSYMIVSGDSVQEISNPALNVGIGFGLFLATMFFFVWFFRSKRN